MDAFELQQEERKICQHIKKSFDKEWSKFSYKKKLNCPPLAESWNCIVGKNFGTHVVH
jgi:hypothetical protein